MDSPEQRPRSHIDDDYKDSLPPVGPAGVAPAQPSLSDPGARRNSVYSNIPGYTLMVAGQRSGKTSFLRLLLDTSNIAPTVSKEQLTPLAKFIQGSNGHTTHIRHVSVDVILDSPDSGAPQPVSLTLIDTPSLDFSDEVSSERVITDIIDHIDSRFADTSEDVSLLPSIPPSSVCCIHHVIPTLHAFPFGPLGYRQRMGTIMFTCKYPVFILDAYFHPRCMRSGLIDLPYRT